jgi:hypothetical protein
MTGTLLLMIVVPLVSFTIPLFFALVPLVCAALLYLRETRGRHASASSNDPAT